MGVNRELSEPSGMTRVSDDLLLNLHRSFPRREVSSHEQVVETGNPDELEELGNRLLNDAVLDVVRLETLPNLVEEIENVVHAESGRLVSTDETVEETSSRIARYEPW